MCDLDVKMNDAFGALTFYCFRFTQHLQSLDSDDIRSASPRSMKVRFSVTFMTLFSLRRRDRVSPGS